MKNGFAFDPRVNKIICLEQVVVFSCPNNRIVIKLNTIKRELFFFKAEKHFDKENLGHFENKDRKNWAQVKPGKVFRLETAIAELTSLFFIAVLKQA